MNKLESQAGWDYIQAYRSIFFVYAAIGAIKFLLACALSKKVEVEKSKPQGGVETTPLLSNGNTEQLKKKSWFALLPDFSKESKIIVVDLCILFALDNFASGLAPL